jgi:hypothetical protein
MLRNVFQMVRVNRYRIRFRRFGDFVRRMLLDMVIIAVAIVDSTRVDVIFNSTRVSTSTRVYRCDYTPRLGTNAF